MPPRLPAVRAPTRQGTSWATIALVVTASIAVPFVLTRFVLNSFGATDEPSATCNCADGRTPTAADVPPKSTESRVDAQTRATVDVTTGTAKRPTSAPKTFVKRPMRPSTTAVAAAAAASNQAAPLEEASRTPRPPVLPKSPGRPTTSMGDTRPATTESAAVAALLRKRAWDPSAQSRLLDPLGDDFLKHEFGAQPTLQDVYDSVFKAFASPAEKDAETVIPVYGMICTIGDFSLCLSQLYHLDTFITKVVVTFNGHNKRAEAVLLALRDALPAGRFTIVLNAANKGVSAGWNNVLRATFGTTPTYEPDDGQDPFCVVANADVQAKPGILAQWAQSIYEDGHRVVNSRLGHFALFAVTQFGFNELGFFDESVFPAYAEDVEYHLRAVSRGLGLESQHFAKFGSNDQGDLFLHNHATSMRADQKLNPQGGGYQSQLARWNGGVDYIMAKWGIMVGSVHDYQFSTPHRTPFNNPKVWHADSWVIDPKHRRCLEFGEGTPCSYNVAVVAQLEHDGRQPDPKPRKARVTTLLTLLQSPDRIWVLVAKEDNTFEVPQRSAHDDGPAVYRLSAESWLERKPSTVAEGMPQRCVKELFDGADPVFGRSKDCEYFDLQRKKWMFLATEGDTLHWPDAILRQGSVPAMRFGKSQRRARILAPGVYTCNLAAFSTADAAPGVKKRCERFVKPGSLATDNPEPTSRKETASPVTTAATSPLAIDPTTTLAPLDSPPPAPSAGGAVVVSGAVDMTPPRKLTTEPPPPPPANGNATSSTPLTAVTKSSVMAPF